MQLFKLYDELCEIICLSSSFMKQHAEESVQNVGQESPVIMSLSLQTEFEKKKKEVFLYVYLMLFFQVSLIKITDCFAH